MLQANKIYTWKFVLPETLHFFPKDGTFIDDLPKDQARTMFLVVAKEGNADDWGAYIDRRALWNENKLPSQDDINITAATGLKIRRNEAAEIFPLFNPSTYRD